MIRAVRRRPGCHARRASGVIHHAMRINAKWTAGHLHPHLPGLVQMHHVQRTSFRHGMRMQTLTCMILSAASDVQTQTHDMVEGAYKTSIE